MCLCGGGASIFMSPNWVGGDGSKKYLKRLGGHKNFGYSNENVPDPILHPHLIINDSPLNKQTTVRFESHLSEVR